MCLARKLGEEDADVDDVPEILATARSSGWMTTPTCSGGRRSRWTESDAGHGPAHSGEDEEVHNSADDVEDGRERFW
jgi:hypothetical protein